MEIDHRIAEFEDSIIDMVGAPVFGRGRRYAEGGNVAKLEWSPEDQILIGTVRGSGGRVYFTNTYIALDPTGVSYEGGDCSCPVGFDCKHTVALAAQAAAYLLTQSGASSMSAQPRWDHVLGALLDTAPAAATVPLGLLIKGEAQTGYGTTERGLYARLVRPGKKGGWINGSLSWHDFAYQEASFALGQVQALTRLHQLYAAASRFGRPAGVKDIPLTDIDSAALWSTLDAIIDSGVQIIHDGARTVPFARPEAGRIVLDVTTDDDGTQHVAPVLAIDEDIVPLDRFGHIGSPTHGLYMFTPASVPADTPLSRAYWLDEPARGAVARLVRLDAPMPGGLQSLMAGAGGLVVPAEDAARFAAEFAPRLERLAPVVSTDDSFTVDPVEPPVLELHARMEDAHILHLSWMWCYRVGPRAQRVSISDINGRGFRDADAELAALVRLRGIPFEQYGLRDGPTEPLRPWATLRGTDTLRAMTELLPLLDAGDDVTVVFEGEVIDYREVNDALSIGVSADQSDDDRTDWFDLTVRVTVEESEVPLATLISALARRDTHLVLDDGRYITLDKPELQSLKDLIAEARSLQETPSDTLTISRFQAGLWEDLAALGVVERQADAWKRQVQGLLDLDDVQAEAPPTLLADLRPYQLDGYRWLEFLWRHRLGGILADDMGLGKTVQSLALLCHARETEPDSPPALILAPSSVVPGWAAEAARFTPHLSVAVVNRTSRKRGTSLQEAIAGADVVVTSHTLFRLDFDEYDTLDWSIMLMDEAQFAKNHQSKLYHCARRLGAPVKVAVTGTPMENNLMELWALLSISAPGLFPSPTRFTEVYRNPIERGGDAELLARLRRRVRPLMLRRTKDQVVRDLPEKQEQVLQVALSPRHRRLYDTHLKREQQKVLGLLGDVDRNRFEIFRSLTMLRRLSLDAALVEPESTAPSAKIDLLLEHLEELVAGGHKALVFSQFTSFLGRVRERLDAAGIAFGYLDGKTRNRGAVIDKFTSGSSPVFLISLKAGGFGLNLTEADYCFILDPWWNPATEQQAVDRAHRIGQTRNVMVYRMISSNTIEEKVMALKERKAALVSGVLDEGAGMAKALDADDIRALLE
ncbi:DEAD/DEAH box helicase [Tomitella cavernea]|uniref:DEAD/DEAH box helicase n=1 Tax=Tomitella cavernea TaxID=1387982 RepID=A0ABP9CM62_9ACTN|nr:DEAD/DEAH box helicase [Tomitella cavernea]